MKSKINWWVILAIIIIGIPIGYVAMFFLNRDDKTDTEQVVEPESEPKEAFLKINNTSLYFDSEGGKQSIDISSNVDWSLSVDEENSDWIIVSPTDGSGDKTVDLEVKSNDDSMLRHAVVTVKWEDDNDNEQEKTVEITQRANEEPAPAVIDDPAPAVIVPPTPPEPSPSANYLSLSSTRVSFTKNGGTKNVSVRSNTNWTVTVSNGDWLSVNPQSDSGNRSVTITAQANTFTDSRTASLMFAWNDNQGQSRSSVISVIQPGATPQPAAFLSVSPGEVTLGANSSSKNVTISSNTDWTVSVSGGDWVRVNTTSGSRNKTLTLRASANPKPEPRSATLTISWSDENGGTRSTTVNISQSYDPNIPVPLTTQQASQIIQEGRENDKIPGRCLIICNGESMQYLTFARQVRNRAFWNIKVTKVECDARGVPVKIMVSADSETEN